MEGSEIPGDVVAVEDTMMGVGDDIAKDAASKNGWIDTENPSSKPSFMDKAIAGAVDLGKSTMNVVTDAVAGTLSLASTVNRTVMGVAGDILSAADGAVGSVVGAVTGT